MTLHQATPSPDEPQLFGSFSADSEQQVKAKEALLKLQRTFSGTPLEASIKDVLSGERTMSDLMREPQLAALLRQTEAKMKTEMDHMSPDELNKMKSERGL